MERLGEWRETVRKILSGEKESREARRVERDAESGERLGESRETRRGVRRFSSGETRRVERDSEEILSGEKESREARRVERD